MEAETDAPTPVNFVQHNYFNLAGNNGDGDDGDDVRDHWLQLNANSVRFVAGIDFALIFEKSYKNFTVHTNRCQPNSHWANSIG